MEAFGRRADDFAALRAQDDGELVSLWGARSLRAL
jgi:hypothetical protein